MTLGFALLALTARTVRADGDQSDIISAHGDARARATSAEALVEPAPEVPPNSAPPVVPSTAVVATPEVSRPAASPASPISAGGSPQTPPAAVADTNSAPKQALPPVVPEGRGRAALIAAGALIALAMFLWERRRKD